MTTKADKLRKVAPGATDETLAELAALPADQVAQITSFARQAARDALSDAAARKRQRKADDRANGNLDEEDFTRRNLGVVTAQARRVWPEPEPGGQRKINTTALEGLARVRRHIDAEIANVVETSRAEGIPDTLIAEALGVTRAAIGQRFVRVGGCVIGCVIGRPRGDVLRTGFTHHRRHVSALGCPPLYTG